MVHKRGKNLCVGIGEICNTLQISWATYYRFFEYRGVKLECEKNAIKLYLIQ